MRKWSSSDWPAPSSAASTGWPVVGVDDVDSTPIGSRRVVDGIERATHAEVRADVAGGVEAEHLGWLDAADLEGAVGLGLGAGARRPDACAGERLAGGAVEDGAAHAEAREAKVVPGDARDEQNGERQRPRVRQARQAEPPRAGRRTCVVDDFSEDEYDQPRWLYMQ